MLSLYYHELAGKVEEDDEKNIWWLIIYAR